MWLQAFEMDLYPSDMLLLLELLSLLFQDLTKTKTPCLFTCLIEH